MDFGSRAYWGGLLDASRGAPRGVFSPVSRLDAILDGLSRFFGGPRPSANILRTILKSPVPPALKHFRRNDTVFRRLDFRRRFARGPGHIPGGAPETAQTEHATGTSPQGGGDPQ